MDVGTILDGNTAVKEGIIDATGNLSDALKCLYDMIDEYNRRSIEENQENHKKNKE